jgi:hypothetical protein
MLEINLKCASCANPIIIQVVDSVSLEYTEFYCHDCKAITTIGESMLLTKRRKKGFTRSEEVETFKAEKAE